MAFTVLLTRSKEDALKDKEIFERYGLRAEILPLIKFEELPFTPPKLENFDYLFFGSKRAAQYFLSKIERLPPSLKVIAVGEKTASFLEEAFGIKPVLVLDGYSETLLTLVDKNVITPGRLLAPLPKVNTNKIQKLSSKGFEIKVIHPYRTIFVKYSLNTVKKALKTVNAIFFASPSAVKSLVINLQNNLNLLREKKIVVIGKTTKKMVESYNFKVWLTAEQPSVEAAAAKLTEALNGNKS